MIPAILASVASTLSKNYHRNIVLQLMVLRISHNAVFHFAGFHGDNIAWSSEMTIYTAWMMTTCTSWMTTEPLYVTTLSSWMTIIVRIIESIIIFLDDNVIFLDDNIIFLDAKSIFLDDNIVTTAVFPAARFGVTSRSVVIQFPVKSRNQARDRH